MNNEKVKEIKENLQEEISLSKEYDLEYRRISSDTLQDFLTLINELESENERLNGKINDMEFVGVGNCLSCNINEKGYKDMVRCGELEEQNTALNKSIEKLTSALQQDHEDRERFRARNEELKDRIAELEKEVETRKAEVLHLQEYGKALIRESELKQFVERLKEKLKDNVNSDNVDNFVECARFISETLKEFANEQKEISKT